MASLVLLFAVHLVVLPFRADAQVLISYILIPLHHLVLIKAKDLLLREDLLLLVEGLLLFIAVARLLPSLLVMLLGVLWRHFQHYSSILVSNCLYCYLASLKLY